MAAVPVSAGAAPGTAPPGRSASSPAASTAPVPVDGNAAPVAPALSVPKPAPVSPVPAFSEVLVAVSETRPTVMVSVVVPRSEVLVKKICSAPDITPETSFFSSTVGPLLVEPSV